MTPTLNYNTVENALAELDSPVIEIVLESDPWNVLEMVRSFEHSCLRMSLGQKHPVVAVITWVIV